MSSQLFADRLVQAIARKGNSICVGIDPSFDLLPGEFKQGSSQNEVAAIERFAMELLKIVAPLVPVVKPQSAYFERYGGNGVNSYFRVVKAARDLGLLVIGDVKRGDIGSTSEAYAAGHLLSEESPDAITINPFLGLDALEPFVAAAKQSGKGLFVLVRTSNPGSADFQDFKTYDGRTFSELLADKLQPLTQGDGLLGSSGWSSLGAVVGATQSHTMTSLRRRLPNSIFLLPGYGAQGATAEMTRAAFRDGQGAIVSASRSIMYPKLLAGESWETAVQRAVSEMSDDLSIFA